jgi:hypothetical protein
MDNRTVDVSRHSGDEIWCDLPFEIVKAGDH